MATKLAVQVIDAYDLMPKDSKTSSSNPFVEVEFDGQVQRTQTKFKDTNPSWNQTLFFNLSDPSAVANSTVEVSVYHEPIPSSSHRRRQFLGRVKLSGISISRSLEESELQRFPLEKRGIFSNIKGEIGLRLYLINSSVDPSAVPPVSEAPASFAAPASVEIDTNATDRTIKNLMEEVKKSNKIKQKDNQKPAETKEFNSIPVPSQTKQENGQAQFFAAPPMRTEFRSVPAQVPPPGMMMRPGPPSGMVMQPGPPPNPYGLIETKPPIAGRIGYRSTDKICSTYDLVEQMQFLYVNVVKARDLPSKDVTGSLDPYAEVKLGNYRGITKYLEKNSNPVWNQVFAFSRENLQANFVEVTVKDKDFIKDDFVGKVVINLTDVPFRVPPDAPLAPQWYKLEDKKGEEKLKHGEIMLAVWIGTQADESFPEAWHSDAHSVGLTGLHQTRSQVYFSPKLCYLRVGVIAAQDLIPAERGRMPEPVVRIQLGNQMRATRPGRSTNPVWNEEFIFVAGEPFDEPLIVSVEDRVGPNKSELLGRFFIPVLSAAKRTDINKPVESKWYSLSKPTFIEEESKFSSKIHLRIFLDTGYHVLDESTHYSSNLQPSNKLLRKPSIGRLEVGILGARNLIPMKAKENRLTDAYCVAKYGSKWIRTRTLLNTLNPKWNEQYTWEVFDPCTVITIAVFDNCHILNGNNNGDQRIGKVRIRLSTLEINKVYTHLYPLLVLQPSGLKKTGELHLAVRFTCTAWVNMVTLYGKPLLPKMHYVQPIPVIQLDMLRHQAMQIVASRLSRAEPPLHREVVGYMLDVDSTMFSLRKSKANFYRITSVLSTIAVIGRWFDGVRNWRNPITTILVHMLFFILVCYPELILPTVFLYLFIIGVWNYKYRPKHPPHMDTKISCAEMVSPDELDEEFDTFPTSKPMDIVRMRYDRMRSVGGRVQTVIGDLATQGERAQAILSWRDPRATAIFVMMALIWALVLYTTPFQVIIVVIALYVFRHPRFRSRMPSAPYNFYRRLPSKADMML